MGAGQKMNRMLLLVIALVAPVFFVAGCSITGRTAGVMDDGIVGCSLSTRIGFLEMNGEAQACYMDKGIYFVIENLGSESISGLSVVLESDYALTMVIKGTAAPGETVQQSLNFGGQALNGVRSLTVYPLVGSAEAKSICQGAGITVALKRC